MRVFKAYSYGEEIVVPNPGWITQLVGALSKYSRVVGFIPSQGAYKKQPMNT